MTPQSALAAVTYVQGNYSTPQTPQATVTLPYTAAQTAGNLNVVIVGWADTTALVSSVTDTRGNVYQLAVGPTLRSGAFSQSIYYSKNISAAAAGANSVTVTFNVAAAYPDIRILEYAGLDTANPVDVVAGASGSSTSSSSGAVTTANASDLLVGANTIETSTTGPGASFTQRIRTVPDANIAEDRVVTAVGSYSATAPVSPSGGWVMQMVAFRAAGSGGSDTQPPTVPTNLTATAASASQINLSWTASTDNVGVTGYLVERCLASSCTFAQIATPSTTTFSDTGLTASTAYSYRVRATDAAGNLSGYSNTANATTQSPDTQAPTAPTNLTATAISGSQINLSWTASTDNVTVTNYLIERCQGAGCTGFAQVATSTTATYSNTGLISSTSYSYRVRATDAAANLSAYSNTASAITQSAPLTPAYVQSNYSAPQSSQMTVTVPYTAAQTAGNLNVVLAGWADTTSLVSSVTDSKGNVYQLAVGPTSVSGAQSQAIYYAKNLAAATAGSNIVTVTFNTAAAYPDIRILEYSGIDTGSPLDGTAAATGSSATSSSGAVTTTNANDLLVAGNDVATATTGAGTGFTSRLITKPDADIAEDQIVAATGPYTATAPVNPAGPWVMQMAAFRAAGSGGGDTQPPTAPASLTATPASLSQINLSWTASTDNVAVTGYRVERCLTSSCTFAQIGTPTGTTFNDTGLTSSTGYSYRVRATDAAGNLSGYSNTASAATQADTLSPTAPATLAATAVSATQINLTWTASTDNVGVTGYLVERCLTSSCTFAQIATPSATTFNDTGLTASTGYSYRARATDAAGNLSGYSNTANATTQTPDTQAPTAPTNLTATVVSGSQINLSWTASTDNVGVTNYLIERCQGAGCSSFAQVATSATTTYNDTGLTALTNYSYRVRATDAAANLSGYSNAANATTLLAPANPAYVQGNYSVPQFSQMTVTVPYTAAQTAGNLNVVIVGWADSTTQVSSVVDSKNNVYQLAVGRTFLSGGNSQSIYYAKNIAAAAAGSNIVTVTFSAAAATPDIRALEYSGVDATTPIDVTVGSTGNSATASSGSVTTTNPTDLLVAADTVANLTTGPGTGFTQRILTSPDGDIVEDRVVTAVGSYTATAPQNNAGGWAMQMVAFRAAGSAAPPPPDTVPPSVSVTVPTAGATLTGTVAVAVSASDASTGVSGVQLQVDGITVGQPDTAGPYTFSLDTTQFANGSHTLAAFAWDGANNFGNATPVSVTFSNSTPGNPATAGLWLGTVNWPLVSVHINLLPNGKVLMWDGQLFGVNSFVWDPVTTTFATQGSTNNIFCSGHAGLADGRVLVAGGHAGQAHVGIKIGQIFDPATNSWTATPNMANARWYPTNTLLPDGRMIVISGETSCDGCDVKIPEIYSPVTNSWTALSKASFLFPYYPHDYVLPDGRLMVTSTSEDPIVSQVLDINLQTWTAVDSAHNYDGGSSAMYLPGKFIKSGTSTDPNLATRPSAATAYVLDMTQPSPAWKAIAPMAFARTYHTMTLLPDGQVLVTSGGPTTDPVGLANAVLPAELWNPSTQTWTTLGSMHGPRLYHSIALLLPDARVLISGGGRFFGGPDPTDQLSAEIFAPPYLFKGPRPAISSAPSQLQYGQAFTVQTPDAARVAKVSLIQLGNVTHAINMSQHFLPLSFTAGSGSLTVTAPANANLAPPAYYMLFLVDTNGVPSVAAIVHF